VDEADTGSRAAGVQPGKRTASRYAGRGPGVAPFRCMRTTTIALGASMLIPAACDITPVVIPDPVPLSGTYSVVSHFEVPAAAGRNG